MALLRKSVFVFVVFLIHLRKSNGFAEPNAEASPSTTREDLTLQSLSPEESVTTEAVSLTSDAQESASSKTEDGIMSKNDSVGLLNSEPAAEVAAENSKPLDAKMEENHVEEDKENPGKNSEKSHADEKDAHGESSGHHENGEHSGGDAGHNDDTGYNDDADHNEQPGDPRDEYQHQNEDEDGGHQRRKQRPKEPKLYFHREDSHRRTDHHDDHGAGHHNITRFPVFTVDFIRVENAFVIGIWIFLACLGKIGFHMTPKLSHIFPESCMLIILGVVIGLLLFYTHAATVSPLTADVFFIYMLPPIILDAGYFMPNRLFFDHLGTILVFAVIGTIWNAFTIGISLYALNLTGIFIMDIPVLHMMLFSSLISAVDPVAVLAVFEEIHVEEVLFILVFGESLLNDGITVVLYHMFEGFSHLGQENLIMQDYFAAIASFFIVALGGTAVGIIWGFLTAFVTRFTKQVRVIEPVFIFVMSYLAYLNAEIFHLSGILAITFCGIAMKNYTTRNISTKSQTTVKYAMKMLAQSSETIIFMFLGVSTVHDDHMWDTAFVGLTILFCSVYRVIGTLVLSTVCNTFRVQKIDFVQKFVISYGGLRGAVAFALVLTIDREVIPAQPLFVTATIAVVYWTVFVQGITIKPLVEMLGVKRSKHRRLTMNERFHERTMDYLMAGIEDVMGKHGNFYIRDKFKRFNTKYLMPLLVREIESSEPKLLETLQNIKMDEAMSYMENQGHPPEQIESFAALYRTAQMARASNSTEGGFANSWNLDVGELDYNPTARDISEAHFHKMLSDEYKPIKRRRGTYKRHAVTDEELIEANPDEECKPNPTYRKTNHHHHHRYHHRKVKTGANGKPGVPVQKLNGTAIKLKHDYLAEQLRDNPAFQPDDTDPPSYDGVKSMGKAYKRVSVKGPVLAETTLPWRRNMSVDQSRKPSMAEVPRRQSSDINTDHTPTAAETQLPWKRNDDDEEDAAPRQAEHPMWANNEDYVYTDSPSHTYLHTIGEPVKPSVHDVFKKRNSAASLYSIDETGDGGLAEEAYARRNSAHSSPRRDGGRRRASASETRRSSLKSSKEDNSYWRTALNEATRRGMSLKEPRDRSEPSSRRNSGFDKPLESPPLGSVGSLLNTAIKEEDSKSSTSPSPRRDEHVINMEQYDKSKSDAGDETKF